MSKAYEGHKIAKSFFNSSNAESYDSVVRLATLGQDSAWKRRIAEIVKGKVRILDLACGTGILSTLLRENNLRAELTGVDLSMAYLQHARIKAGDLSNCSSLINATAEIIPCKSEYFDAVVSSYLAKYIDNFARLADECWRVLQPGGVIVFHDFKYPEKSRMMSFFWRKYFDLLRIAGLVAESWRYVFDSLEDVIIRRRDWISKSRNALQDRGFVDVTSRCLTLETSAIVSARKP